MPTGSENVSALARERGRDERREAERRPPSRDTEPMSATMMLSCRTMRRVCRRLMPIARSMPSSRVRSNTERTSVLTMPNRLTITDSASST